MQIGVPPSNMWFLLKKSIAWKNPIYQVLSNTRKEREYRKSYEVIKQHKYESIQHDIQEIIIFLSIFTQSKQKYTKFLESQR